MAIPDFQTLMLPTLTVCADGAEHTLKELNSSLADRFELSPEEREQLQPSGRQRTFYNRTAWAYIYLKGAGLLESDGRGRMKITSAGKRVLVEAPSKIDIAYLNRFPAFREYRGRNGETAETKSDEKTDRTPEELLAEGHRSLRAALAQELVARLKACSPAFFERLVVDLLVAMGYGGSIEDAAQVVGKAGDGGIDGVIKEDRLGLDSIYIQAKRWKDTVGRPAVQAFAGSLEGHRARKGVLITTSGFSADARDYVSRIEKKIVLIDGVTLASYMIDHNVGVTPHEEYVVKRIDLDYFEDD